MISSVRELVAAARSQIDNLSVDQVAGELESGDVTLVDIREPDEVWCDGTIPGSIQAPRGMLEFYADPASPYYRPEFEPAARIILYCASGGRSALAVQTLRTLGYTDVAHLDGGLTAWRQQGRPVTEECG